MDKRAYAIVYMGSLCVDSIKSDARECVREFLLGFCGGTTMDQLERRNYQLVEVEIAIGDKCPIPKTEV